MLAESRSGVERVRNIVRDLRDFARVDSDGQQQRVDINLGKGTPHAKQQQSAGKTALGRRRTQHSDQLESPAATGWQPEPEKTIRVKVVALSPGVPSPEQAERPAR